MCNHFCFLSTERKPKLKKEKVADSADGISNVFAKMSLKNSSNLIPSSVLPRNANPPTSGSHAPKPPKQSNKHDIHDVSDSSLSQAFHQPDVPASFGPIDASSQGQTSISVSAVIDELQLSNIDWEALSFIAAPSPQNMQGMAGLKPVNKSKKNIKDEQSSSYISGGLLNTKQPACVLRETKILRNNVQVQRMGCKPNAELSHISSKPKDVNLVSLSSHRQVSGPSRSTCMPPGLKEKRQQLKESSLVEAPTKYKFVKVKHSKKQYSNPQPTGKEYGCKMSVCVRQGPSSDDENHPDTDQRKVKGNHTKTLVTQNVVPQLIEPVKQIMTNEQHNSANVPQRPGTTLHEKPQCIDISKTNPKTQECIVKSGGGSSEDDDDDYSYVSISSPLPLAERLKLKFSK